MRSLVASLLADQGPRLMVARSGREGLAKLQASAEHVVVVSSGVLQDVSVAEFVRADTLLSSSRQSRQIPRCCVSGRARCRCLCFWSPTVPTNCTS
jgi:hypothetical protein